MKKVLVLGSEGFIGHSVIDSLKEKSIPYIGFDIVDKEEDAHYIKGDLSNVAKLSPILHEVDAIIHLISETNPSSSMNSPELIYKNDIVNTIKLLDLSRQAGIKRIIYASSGGTIYGIPREIPISEEHPTNPLNHYGIGKLTIEKILLMYNEIYEMNNIILRISNPFGKNQDFTKGVGIISAIINAIKNKSELSVWGDGEVIRDYINIKDVAHAFILAIENKNIDGIFNVGSGTGLSINEIISIFESFDIELQVKYQRSRKFDVPSNILNIQKARDQLKYVPKYSFIDSVRELVACVLNKKCNE